MHKIKLMLHDISSVTCNIIFLCIYCLLAACTTTPTVVDTTNLESLENISADDRPDSVFAQDLTQLRYKSMIDTAMSLGAQAGLAYESDQINLSLEKDKRHLETIFNFNGMMLSHGVLPPVLEEGDNSLNLADPNTIRIADKTYVIVEQARFATTPPNWREYLHLSFTKPDMPHKALLPKTSEERAAWRKAILLGWDQGIQQANNIFQQDLARLKRDYQGMILYRKLLQEHMISPPYVSKTMMGVTGNGDNMRVNDQVLRITALPRLQTDSSGWKAVVVKQYDY